MANGTIAGVCIGESSVHGEEERERGREGIKGGESRAQSSEGDCLSDYRTSNSPVSQTAAILAKTSLQDEVFFTRDISDTRRCQGLNVRNESTGC